MSRQPFAPAFNALHFDDAARLYRLQGEGALSKLLVQAWSLKEQLDAPWTMELVALDTDAGLDTQALLGQRLTLHTVLADGSLHPRSGLVFAARAGDADGGFARWRLTVRPWIALLGHTRRSQVWQEQSLVQIVESVFARYSAHARWRWTDDVTAHLARSPFVGTGQVRSYTVQYRETDLAFLTRLLAEEGIGWRMEETGAAQAGSAAPANPAGPPARSARSARSTPASEADSFGRIVFFADSPGAASCPADRSSEQGGGIRFHRASSQEHSDAVQAFGSARVLQAAEITVLSWDYWAKRVVAASVPTNQLIGGPNAPRLEAYEPARAYAFATPVQAQCAATLSQEAIEARNKTWLGCATVRSFTAGTSFELTGSPLDTLASLGQNEPERRFLLTAVIHAGINNLPKDIGQRIAGVPHAPRFDAHGFDDDSFAAGGFGAGDFSEPAEPADLLAPWVGAEVRAQAAATGYGNRFEALDAHVPWRPALTDEAGRRLNNRPTAQGPLTATVVGADGSSHGSGAEQIHTDRLGRIRIRHDFQPPGEASTWVRVMQRWAGAGMGCQFIPRIGQQVLVGFMDNDIERPLVIGALYDGRGEGGVPATPGGKAAHGAAQGRSNAGDGARGNVHADKDTSAASAASAVFSHSADHRPAGQGNTTGGHAPPWHGASPAALEAGGQRNAAALSGWKTQEFGTGAAGHNQLVFDDSDAQLRVQLASTQHASQLNLGHLIHQADNHRGSFRGLGFELRTDAYGAVRAKQGLLISSYGTRPGEPAGDNAAGIALAGQLAALGKTLSEAANLHQTVKLAGHIGSTKAKHSALSDTQAPLAALHTALKGMVSDASAEQAAADAASKNTQTAAPGAAAGPGRLPHTTDPVIAITAKAELAVAAGQDLQLAAGETIALGAGRDSHFAIGGTARIHSGQAIGMLGGAVGAGEQAAGTGLTFIAGQGDIELQAQADKLQIAAKDDVTLQSATSHIDWAAAKRIVLSTAGGASITIEGGNITAMCPGKITVRAGQKSFGGPQTYAQGMNAWPQATPLDEQYELRWPYDGSPLKNRAFEIVRGDGSVIRGVTDANGKTGLQKSQFVEALCFRLMPEA
ncbi:MAG: type VI secretion system tip protein VgrG [Methylibium sp.]|uniref:type VI secretion system Vgr family protein n=1 Tax=Methylibium sp. TaxID=2067992 RepID=UPI0017FFC732|nr:contractile injection system protein, VgrG/Pvc8 family [Methylibium sp.]MBA3597386.1 type VI secretion system tip protein VgrG [Methylibium sp.]